MKWCSLPYEESTWELEEDVDPAKVKEFESLQVLPEIKHVVMYPCLAPLVTGHFMTLAILDVCGPVLRSGLCWCLNLGYSPLNWEFSAFFSPNQTLLALWSTFGLGSILMCVTFKNLEYELRFLGIWCSMESVR